MNSFDTKMPTSDDELYCKSPDGGHHPVYMHLNCDLDTPELSFDWQYSHENGIPMSVYHRLAIRWHIDAPLTMAGVGKLVKKAAPLLETIIDGWSDEWDGSNRVGRLTYEAQCADEELDRLCEGASLFGAYNVWDAADYYQGMSLDGVGLSAGSTDATIREVAEGDVERAALDDNYLDIEDVVNYLTELVESHASDMAEEIDELWSEALDAGDDAQVALCDKALEGDVDACRECARVIEVAAAMGDR